MGLFILTSYSSFYRLFSHVSIRRPYFSFPFCQEAGQSRRYEQSLGEDLIGDYRQTTPYDIRFKESKYDIVLCTKRLDRDDIHRLMTAIKGNAFVELIIEDLPAWTYVGDVVNEDYTALDNASERIVLFRNVIFHLGYNKGQIVTAKVTTDVRFQS